MAGPRPATVLEVPRLLRQGCDAAGRRLLRVLLGKAASLLFDSLVDNRGQHHGAIGFGDGSFAVDHLADLVCGEPVLETIDVLNIHHGGESQERRKNANITRNDFACSLVCLVS